MVALEGLEISVEADVPRQVLNTPGMLAPHDRNFLYGLTKDYYTGEGRIVDAGVFLGASTVCFGSGFIHSSVDTNSIATTRPIEAFELGLLNKGTAKFLHRKGISSYHEVGDCFLDLLRNNMAPVASYVNLNAGDICNYVWNTTHAVEILFLDVVNSMNTNKHVIDEYFPQLIPEKSFVIQKNYYVNSIPHTRVTQEFLAGCFEYLGGINSTAVFKLKSEIPRSDLNKAKNYNFSVEEELDLLSRCIDRAADPVDKCVSAFVRLKVLVNIDRAKAKCEFDSIVKSYLDCNPTCRTNNRVAAARISAEKAMTTVVDSEMQSRIVEV